MSVPQKYRLLFAPYRPPALRRGDRANCLLRDCQVVITSWSDGRISWPRCLAIGIRGGIGLLVDEELARAVRNEAAEAVKFWWGASRRTVSRWRKALAVSRNSSEGSRRLIQAAAEKGAAVIHESGLTDEQCAQRSEQAKRLNLGRFLVPGYQGRWWTKKELNLLGKLPDEEVAARIGRTPGAVRVMRTRLGIATARDGRRTR
jgi:hypothetical protein